MSAPREGRGTCCVRRDGNKWCFFLSGGCGRRRHVFGRSLCRCVRTDTPAVADACPALPDRREQGRIAGCPGSASMVRPYPLACTLRFVVRCLYKSPGQRSADAPSRPGICRNASGGAFPLFRLLSAVFPSFSSHPGVMPPPGGVFPSSVRGCGAFPSEGSMVDGGDVGSDCRTRLCRRQMSASLPERLPDADVTRCTARKKQCFHCDRINDIRGNSFSLFGKRKEKQQEEVI